MAVTAPDGLQPMTAFAATANCGNGANNRGCTIQVCQSYGGNTETAARITMHAGKNGNACNPQKPRDKAGISRKNLSGKICSSPQMISYVMGSSACRR